MAKATKIDLEVKKPYGNEHYEIGKFKGTGDAIISANALGKAAPSNYEYSVKATNKYVKGGGLKGNQKKLDLNKNGKLDSNDFKMLRSKKGNGGGTGVSSETGYAVGTNSDLLMNQDYLAYKKGGGVEGSKSHMIIEDDDTYVYVVMFDKLEDIKDNGNKLQSLLMDITNYGDLNVVTWTTPANVNTREKFKNWWENQQEELSKEYANGGSLADTPESFPSTDAMSYKKGGAVNYAVVDENSDRIYVKSTDKNFINKKHKELKEIYPNDKLSVVEFAEGGSTKGFEYSIGGL